MSYVVGCTICTKTVYIEYSIPLPSRGDCIRGRRTDYTFVEFMVRARRSPLLCSQVHTSLVPNFLPHLVYFYFQHRQSDFGPDR